MFLHVCVILFTGGISGQGEPPWAGRTPPWTRQTPWQGEPPLARQTPQTRQTPHPPCEADSRIQSTSGRYASYWNAFLFLGISIVKTGFMGRGSSTQFDRYPLKKKFTQLPPPPREKTTFTTTCVGKNVLREYIRLARCKLIGPGTGENFTPVPESHKLTIKVVDKKSRCNLFIDSATDNVESVSHSLLSFCLLEKTWLIRKPSNCASKINPKEGGLDILMHDNGSSDWFSLISVKVRLN